MSYKDKVIGLGKVYLASGWFTPTQLERLEAVKKILIDEGFEVFSPKDEALVTPDSTTDWQSEVFKGNLTAIEHSSFLLGISNEKDMGTLFEIGYAYHKTPAIYFAEGLNGPFNLMLAKSAVSVATSRDNLIEILNDESVMKSIYNSEYSGNCYVFDGIVE